VTHKKFVPERGEEKKRKWQTVNSKYRYWKAYLSCFSGWRLKF
jgi:hypothetical protein